MTGLLFDSDKNIETADPIEIIPKNLLDANLFEFNKDSGYKTFGSEYKSNSLNHSNNFKSGIYSKSSVTN